MRGTPRRKPTLMPLVALAALGLSVTLPVLSTSVHAASPVAYSSVTVRPGDTVWSLAERRTPAGGDVQGTVDAILAANHLGGANLTVGQHLQLPR
jgi:LysM repeat protein